MAHTAFDGESIYSVDQNLALDEFANKNRTIEDHMQRFKFFLRDWTEDNRYKYREQIMKAKPGEDTLMELDLDDITAFDDALMQGLSNYPDDYIARFEEVTSQIYSELHEESYKDNIATFQFELTSSQKPRSLRELTSDLVGKLVVIPGIVVSCSKPAIKSYRVAIQCKGCQQELFVPVESGMSGIEIPRVCLAPRPAQGVATEKCPRDPYVIIPERCLYTLHQTMKIQESPENVPVGEMPRSFQVTFRGKAVDKVTPGIKVTLIAMLCLPDNKTKALVTRSSYLKAAGVKLDKTVESKLKNFFTLDDEDTFRELARDPQIYNKLAKSVAPSIYGNDDIKKAIACMLFGGTRKKVPEGIRLRGDINVLMLGDPSTAKSQFLKFVNRVAPISVYTSGKGSSAAGLTASVTRDAHTREFQLEGGAMVLADGGVVCIDEFDKMQASDRVAIHEAMEQQTISVAKAGITTILNTRVSVLAAANPSAGTYDDLKQAQEQIEFQSTILSRFDTIFLVRDNRDPAHDRLMASHILNLHMLDSNITAESGEIDIDDLKKYIAFARYKCFPRINQESGDALINFYVNDRAKNSNGAFPITVRQLEAIVRLSEALAKMKLSEVVTKTDVEEAHRLFEVSTLNASLAGISSSGVHVSREVAEIALKVEESIRRMVGINSRISYETLKEKLETRYQNKEAIKHAIVGMITRGELEHRAQQSKLVRIK